MGLAYTHSNLSRQPAVTLILIMRSKLNQWMSFWWSVQKERFHLPVSLLLRGHEILITHNITEIVWENSSPNHPETNCLMIMFHANENLSCLLLNTNKVNGQHYLAFKVALGVCFALKSWKEYLLLFTYLITLGKDVNFPLITKFKTNRPLSYLFVNQLPN